MKFYILFFYTAHLLTDCSVGYLLTTPMQSALRSKRKNEEPNQVFRVVEMIEFINGGFKDHGRNKAFSGRYDGLHPKRVSRRFDLPTLVVNNLPASVVPKEDEKETQLEKIEEPVRYHVIDNLEVLEENRNKQKKEKERARYLMKRPSSINSDNQSLEAKYLNTDAKLTSHHSNAPLKVGLHDSTSLTNTSDTLIQSSQLTTNPNFGVDGVQELTNIKPIYSPVFTGDNSMHDNDKPRTADIYKTNDFEKKTGNKARDMKQKVNAHEDNAHTESLDDTRPNKLVSQSLHSDNVNNNDQVTEKDENKEIRADNVNLKNNDYSVKNQGEIERKDTEPQHRFRSKNKRKHTTLVHGTSRKHKKKSKQDREEEQSINGQQDRNEHSHRPHKKKKYDKNDNNKKEVKKDKKRNDKGNGEKEIDIHNRDNQRYHAGHVYDRMEYEWNKRHLQNDKNYDYKNDKQTSIDDVIDDDWDKRHDLIKKENNWKKRDSKHKKGERNYNERGSRITQDRKLNMRENIDSVIEKEDARYLSNERLNQSW